MMKYYMKFLTYNMEKIETNIESFYAVHYATSKYMQTICNLLGISVENWRELDNTKYAKI